jgi:hypothetical protein
MPARYGNRDRLSRLVRGTSEASNRVSTLTMPGVSPDRPNRVVILPTWVCVDAYPSAPALVQGLRKAVVSKLPTICPGRALACQHQVPAKLCSHFQHQLAIRPHRVPSSMLGAVCETARFVSGSRLRWVIYITDTVAHSKVGCVRRAG